MSYKCNFCGEITLTPNHVCEQATQKMIDQMDKATETVQSWSKEKRETMNLSKEQEPAYDRLHNICRNVGMGFKEATELLNQLVLGTYNENNKLRAELATKEKELTNTILAFEEMDAENNRLRAAFSAERDKWDYYQNFVKGHGADSITDLVVQRDKERKKREEAENVLADWLDCWDIPEEWMRCRNNAKIVLGRDADPKSYSPPIIEVLREGLQEIVDGHCEDKSGCSCCDCDVETAKEALANLPSRSAAIGKVLEAAEEYVVSCQEEAMGPRFLEETNLFEAVRERRKK